MALQTFSQIFDIFPISTHSLVMCDARYLATNKKSHYKILAMSNSQLDDFIGRAKEQGASEETLVAILTGRGWSQKAVHEALAARYERLCGIEIPRHGGYGTSARDAFFYLLIFSTLATWTFGLGSLAFTLIDGWFADPLFAETYQYSTYAIASALACILIAFPIYLLLSQVVNRDVRQHAEKMNSAVRKWLTYLALAIAASVFIGDLITALTYLLRGEITSRFLAKVLVVLLISGGVFFYYFEGFGRSEDSAAPGKAGKGKWMAALSASAVLVMAILGFSRLGAPRTQRVLRADEKRVQELYQISQQIYFHWASQRSSNPKLPAHLDQLQGVALADPVTREAYEYHPKDGSRYELCATFLMSSEQNEAASSRTDMWAHPSGRHCFQLDAAEASSAPTVYYY